MKKKQPDNWVEVYLEELIKYALGGDWGKDPNQYWGEDFQNVFCIRGSELKDWRKNKGKTAALRKIKNSSLEKRKLILGDILLEISGGGPDQPVGRTVIIDEEVLSFRPDIPKTYTNFFRLLRIVDPINKQFINYFLQYFYHRPEIVNYQGGSNNLRNLRFKDYITIKIPVPPVSEQTCIVAKLDQLFGHLDKLKTRLDKIPKLLKQFRQAVLTQAVTGKLTEEWRGNEEKSLWRETTIGELFDVKTGATPKRGTSKYYTDGNIPWIKSGLVKNDMIYEADEFITDIAIEETNAKVFPQDTLLVAMYGEGKTRGQVGWMKIEAATNQAIAALVNDQLPLITKSYVFYYCLSQYNEIRAQAEGGNQPNLNLSKIKNWKIQLPPDQEQEKIVRKVEALFSRTDKIEKQYNTLKEQIENLPQTILAKAFRGELVEQDPEDEPAEVLLKRIKEEREKISKKKVKAKQKPTRKKNSRIKNSKKSTKIEKESKPIISIKDTSLSGIDKEDNILEKIRKAETFTTYRIIEKEFSEKDFQFEDLLDVLKLNYDDLWEEIQELLYLTSIGMQPGLIQKYDSKQNRMVLQWIKSIKR